MNAEQPHLTFFREGFGCSPNHIRALASLPRLIESEFQISNCFLFRERALTRGQKGLLLLAIAVACENLYTTALHYQTLRGLGFGKGHLGRIVSDYHQAGLAESDVALLDFAMRLGSPPTWVTTADIERLRSHGLTDEHILEAVLTISWGGYLCNLSSGLGVKPHFDPPWIPASVERRTVFQDPSPRNHGEPTGPYIRTVDIDPASFAPFVSVREKWGFIPNLFRCQMLWPDLVEAELRALNLWLNTGDVLSQRQKECIFLAISAANLNTYCVAAHCEILRALGVPEEDADQIALDHHHSNLCPADKTLLDVCLKLARQPAAFGETDKAQLRELGFSEQQIIEAVVIVAVTSLINTLNTGLGVEPDFKLRVPLDRQNRDYASVSDHPTEQGTEHPPPEAPREDPDAASVARVQAGDSDAFEELVRRHGRRVYRTLAGILRQAADIEDAVQDTFVKAFRNIGEFQGRSSFATWLTRIAVNAGLQRLRGHKDLESLDASPRTLDEFRPRLVQPWQEDPENAYSKEEMRELILKALRKVPLKYRVVVMLRDLQQLSTAETASVLGLQISAVKARLFRGRLMLREALAPHFTKKRRERPHG